MSRIGSRLFSLRTLQKIKDSADNITRQKGTDFEVDEKRFFEIKETLKDKFETYFLITKIYT